MISDATEGCFSFEDLYTDNYLFSKETSADASYSEILKMAIEMEGKIQRFYLDAAEVSMSLMADIPKDFKGVAKERDKRKTQLESFYKMNHTPKNPVLLSVVGLLLVKVIYLD